MYYDPVWTIIVKSFLRVSVPKTDQEAPTSSFLQRSFRSSIRVMRRDFPGGPVVQTAFLLQRARVHSLIQELRPHMLHSMAKK